jgi:hypothetical protein
MNISLEEQIEYIRRIMSIGWEYDPDSGSDNMLSAILATLEAVKQEAILKDVDHILAGLAFTKPDTGP